MKIGELAQVTGVAASTIRFYEKQGLLPKVPRTSSGYRQYDDKVKARLDCIRLGQKLGFSLEELPKLLSQEENLDHEMMITRLASKQQELADLIAKLSHQKNQIEQLKQQLNTTWQLGQCMSAEQINVLLQQADL
ncbi:MerR family DNA-binding transcriptional regulator [Planctobacterium marinum]|uniref:Transcriptional regulator n=1 Tax=Planctobacterium marinum TaxID=1631968 RepID=A0AA48HG54_9ALTE|nr:transcriptional regulator [Planctobacterium marinum]